MKLKFHFSKNQEAEKLLDIFHEYQWFIDNDFPIVLPKFFDRIYKDSNGNKTLFSELLKKKLNRIYCRDFYEARCLVTKQSWQKKEKDFFRILARLGLKIPDKFICRISLYGPEGQYQTPNIISARAATKKDLVGMNETIAHEIIHLLIFNTVKKLALDYRQTEGLVDLFFVETDLKNIFPKYKVQSVGIGNKELLKKIILFF